MSESVYRDIRQVSKVKGKYIYIYIKENWA